MANDGDYAYVPPSQRAAYAPSSNDNFDPEKFMTLPDKPITRKPGPGNQWDRGKMKPVPIDQTDS